jgi:hypothetical protein
MAGRGRPGSAPQAAKREQFARLIARGVSNSEACRIVGVNRRTGKRWRHGRTITAQRWEYEISLREIETQMLEPGGGLRSKSPELLRQELWGLLLAHFAIRSLMAEAATSAGLDPDRLSFMRSISLVRRQVTDQAAFSPRKARTSQGNSHRGDPGTSK